jgi:hypothetical protein
MTLIIPVAKVFASEGCTSIEFFDAQILVSSMFFILQVYNVICLPFLAILAGALRLHCLIWSYHDDILGLFVVCQIFVFVRMF